MKFSVVAIVWNEEKRLEKCLSQFKGYTNDIVIFDTESTDRTNEIARKFTDKVWVVPYVGYTSSYDCQAWLKADNDWCLCVCADEEYYGILDWLVCLDTSQIFSAVAFQRAEIIDNKAQPFNKAFHTRVIHRNRIWTYELLDPPFHLSNNILYSDKLIGHVKDSNEMKIDEKNRSIAGKLLAEKYKYTKLEPYSYHRENYKSYGE